MLCPSFSERPAAPGICRRSPRGSVLQAAPGWGRWTREFPRSVTCWSNAEGKLAVDLVRGGHGRRQLGLTTATRCEAARVLADAVFSIGWPIRMSGVAVPQFGRYGDLDICVASALLATSLLASGAALVCDARRDLFVEEHRRS